MHAAANQRNHHHDLILTRLSHANSPLFAVSVHRVAGTLVGRYTQLSFMHSDVILLRMLQQWANVPSSTGH